MSEFLTHRETADRIIESPKGISLCGLWAQPSASTQCMPGG